MTNATTAAASSTPAGGPGIEYWAPTPRLNPARTAKNVYRAMIAFDDAIEFDPALRELVRLRASIVNGCAYCVDMHTNDARAAGEHDRRLSGVAAWAESPFFTARERAALALCDEMTRLTSTGVTDAVWADAEAHFPTEELSQLVWAITAINAWNRIGVACHLLPDS